MPTRLLLATLPLFVVSRPRTASSARAGRRARARSISISRATCAICAPRSSAYSSAAGIEGIAEYLRAVPGIARGVGYVADAPAFRLDATFETLNFYEYWRTEPLRQRRCVHRISRRAPHRLSDHAEAGQQSHSSGRSRRRFWPQRSSCARCPRCASSRTATTSSTISPRCTPLTRAAR